MSETTATAIKFAAAIIMAVVLVGIGIMVFTPAADSAKSVTTDFTSTTTELQDQKYLTYDNTKVSGSQVINALRKFKSQAAEGSIGLYVQTGKDGSGTTSGTWYYANFDGTTVSTTGAQTDLSKTSDVKNTGYVNPAGMFKADVQRDKNGVIRAIKFIQEAQN